jgi:hypothetical protein
VLLISRFSCIGKIERPNKWGKERSEMEGDAAPTRL